MFTLSIRSLDGSILRMDVKPDTTIAEVKQDLEQCLPPLHEVRLFQGAQELFDGAQVEVELQAVSVQSIRKVIARLGECVDLVNTTTPARIQEFSDLLEVLQEQEVLLPADCMLLLAIPCRFHAKDLHGRQITRLPYRQIARLGMVFGRVCGDPSPYLDTLTRDLRSDWSKRGAAFFASAALAEISSRCEKSLSRESQKSILEWAGNELPKHWRIVNENCCVIIGKLGDSTHEHLLEDALRIGYCAKAAAVALQEIRARKEKLHMSVFDLAVGVNSLDEHAIEETGASAGVALMDTSLAGTKRMASRMEEEAGEQEGEQDAMHTSLEDALLQEQEELTEAILRSKIEARADNDDDVLLSRLTGCSEKVRQVLFDSACMQPIISRVLDAGSEISPSWARGAILLVPMTVDIVNEAGHDLRDFNIMHYRKDLACIKQALASIPKRQDRPKIKDERRSKIPRDCAASDVATVAAESVMSTDDSVGVDSEGPAASYEIIVENTFYTVRSVQGESDTKCARSAP